MKKARRWGLLFMLLCMSAFSAIAQRVVSGVVQDSAGTPLPGITYKLKGTKISGATDNTGRFSLTVPAAAVNGTIEFIGVGYKEMQVPVVTQNRLVVILLSEAKQLSEVVVTGFGESRNKRNLGYSVTQVSGDDIRRASAINPIAALQGMVPGMQVQPGIGGPQSTTRFLIRGSASLDPYRNQPLIVVDDIVMDKDVVVHNTGGDQDFGNILKDLNPDDIESVSVLKGGAVTALYGNRAANGVILIKTKKGFSQRGLGVTFSENLMWDKAYKTTEFQNEFGSGTSTKDFLTGPDGMLQINPNTYGYNFGPPMTGQTVLDVTGKVIQNNPRPNNVLDVFRLGLTSNANVGMSGGNEKGTFRLSCSNLHSNAITPNNKFDRNSLSFRGTQRLATKVLVDANASYVKSTSYNPANQGGLGVLRN